MNELKPLGVSMENLLTIEELGKYLKLSVRTLYPMAKEGKIPGVKVGGSWRFRLSEVNKWIDDNKEGDN